MPVTSVEIGAHKSEASETATLFNQEVQQTTTMMITKTLALILSFASVCNAAMRGESKKEAAPFLQNEGGRNLGMMGMCDSKFKETSIRAEIDSNGFKATISATDTAPGKATWEVKIDEVDIPNFCSGGTVNWHIHTKALAEGGCDGFATTSDGTAVPECGGAFLGGHWDPSLACGGASDFAATTCKGLNHTWVGAYSTRCTNAVVQSGCEYGDISGKVGPIDLAMDYQSFEDTFIQTPVADFYSDLSIVLHCGSPRVACANFFED